jgi:CheY-like chemotaxis protein
MPCRILVVDDDPISLAIAAVLLESEGFAVLQAESGEQALNVLAGSEPPACILADLRMPTLCGPQLARRLRACAPRVLLFAMSATPPPAVEGYDGVLEKPLTPEGLRAALDRIGKHSVPTPVPIEAAGLLDDAVFDRLRRAMTTNALQEVIDAFLKDTASRVVDMRTADALTVRRQAHTVKGGAAMLGAIQVSSVASILEEGVDQPGEQLRKLDELEHSLRETEVILKQRLKI